MVEPLATLGDREAKKALAAWRKALLIQGKVVKRIEVEAIEGSTWSLRAILAMAAEAVDRGGPLFVAHRIS